MHVQERDDLEAANAIFNDARAWSKRLRGEAGAVTTDELRQLLDMIEVLAAIAARSIERRK